MMAMTDEQFRRNERLTRDVAAFCLLGGVEMFATLEEGLLQLCACGEVEAIAAMRAIGVAEGIVKVGAEVIAARRAQGINEKEEVSWPAKPA